MINVIVACDEDRGFGIQDGENGLPWGHVPEDMTHFHCLTTSGTHNVMIMGRKTWESLPNKVKNDPERYKVVISNSLPEEKIGYNTMVMRGLSYKKLSQTDKTYWVIGGAKYLTHILANEAKYINKIYLTRIRGTYECDVFLPKFPPYFIPIEKRNFSRGHFVTYQNCLHPKSEETQYLDLLKKVLERGNSRPDRTGVGTLSLFGHQLRFNLQDGFPLLTTKRVFFRGVAEELLFFLRGDHDNRKLQAVGVHIWDGNTSREYLDKCRPHLETHDLSLAYGVQWRSAGAKLGNIDTDYRGQGIDQVAEVIHLLREDPYSRRIIINAWNVPSLKDMCLVPCHVMYQFYVQDGYLSCMMTQRSADLFLGLPFNIASTALLTHIFAHTVGLKPGEVIISIGDAHIYNNHMEQVKEQLQRECILFPQLKINKNLETVEDIEQLQYTDLELINYGAWPTIKAEMAV